MSKSTNGQDRNQKRLGMVVGSLIMSLVLSGCVYFLPSHPIVVAAVIVGFLLTMWREREAKLVFDLAFSFWIWILSTMCSRAMKILKIFKWPLQALRILPKNDD